MDEIIHSGVRDDKWRILGWRIFTMWGMVVIVTQQSYIFNRLDAFVLQKWINLFCWGMNKEKWGEKRLCNDSLLPMLPYLFISQRNIAFQSFSFDESFCLDNTPIRNTQNKPLLVFKWHILYRHPTFVLWDGGRTRGKSCTWTRWTCVSRLPIIQWSVSRWRLFGVIFQCYWSEVGLNQ